MYLHILALSDVLRKTCLCVRVYDKIFMIDINQELMLRSPVAEFSVSICSTSKFICSSDGGVPRLSQEMIPLVKVTFTKTG